MKYLKDDVLLEVTYSAAMAEKKATLVLLEYLTEIDRRKVYCTRAYSSLFEYIVKELKYSESQAYERVNAVRLLRQSPEVKQYFESGSLSLTNASKIQRFIQIEKKTGAAVHINRKKEIIQACLGQSKRAVEKVLFENSSEATRNKMNEQVKLMADDRIEIKFSMCGAMQFKLDRVKELIGEQSLEVIFEQALSELIKLEEKKRGMMSDVNQDVNNLYSNNLDSNNLDSKIHDAKKTAVTFPDKQQNKSEIIYKNPRYIPLRFKKVVSNRSKNQCEYMDSNKKRCSSKYRLQIDHIVPLACNGKTELNNLRHLCANHNSRMAIEWGIF